MLEPRKVLAGLRPLAAVLAAILVSSCGSPEPAEDSGGGQPPGAGGDGGAARPASAGEPEPGPDGRGFGLAMIAQTRELEGDLEGAEKAWREALAGDPGSSHLVRSLARVLLLRRKDAEALGTLSEHLKVRDDPAARIAMIRILDGLGREDLASKEVETLMAGPQLAPEQAGELAARALRRKDVIGAADALCRARVKRGEEGEPERAAGELLLERGYSALAAERFRSSLGKQPGSRARVGLARALARSRNWKAAFAEANAWCEANPADLEAGMLAGELALQAGDAERAAARFRAAAELPGGRAAGMLWLARSMRRQGRRAGAAEAYGGAMSAGSTDAAFELGTLLEESGDLDGAEAALAGALRDPAVRPRALGMLALVWARARTSPGKAAAAIGEALRAEPRSPAWLAVQGYVLHRSGDAEGARAAFGRALSGDADPFVLRIHGEYLQETGSSDAAAEQWRRAIELDPRLLEVLGGRISGGGR